MTLASASTGTRFVGVRVSDAVEAARKSGAGTTARVTAWEPSVASAVERASALPEGATLFSLYRLRAYYPRDQLRAALAGNPRSGLDSRSAEAEVRAKCRYVSKGHRRGQWALRQEYVAPDSAKRDEERPLRELFAPGQTFSRRELQGSVVAVTGRLQLAEAVVAAALEAGAVVQSAASAAPSSSSSSSSFSSSAPQIALAPPARRPRSVVALLRRRAAASAPLYTAEQVVASLMFDLTMPQIEEQIGAVCSGEVLGPEDLCELDAAKAKAWEEAASD